MIYPREVGASVVDFSHKSSHVRDWIETLSGNSPRVLLAEGADDRVVRAARWLAENTPVRPILVRPSDPTPSEAREELVGVEVQTTSSLRSHPDVLAALRDRPDGSSRSQQELESTLSDPLFLAAAHVVAGASDACVAGACAPTAAVIRAAIKVIGLAPGVSTVSSSFLMFLPDGRRLAFGDCAVLPAPDRQQLADVAVATASSFRDLLGAEPKVAMLSFSTKGSAEHPEIDIVRSATAIAREMQPHLRIDGELQFDAAMIESVARSKASESTVAGKANVLIFPNLAAGNIGYKITEQLGGATAIGPILQGLAAPMNDLSRGCSKDDIIGMALLSAVQSVRRGQPEHIHHPLDQE